VSDEIAAALMSVAPGDDDSGKRSGERLIKGGVALYAMCGRTHAEQPVLKAYHQRLLAEGKEPKVAIIACMRKLIVILNTMIDARRQLL
jgi:transposase